MPSFRKVTVAAVLAAAGALPSNTVAASTRPQVDLSVSVTTAPVPFVPGGVGTVTMTVHNAGPDTAGSVLPDQREIIVFEHGYNVTNNPPPYELFEPAEGCSAYAEYSEYIPGQGVFLLFSFYFDDIAAGASRTCTYRVRFLASTRESFATSWLVSDSANDDDINPGNNRFDYQFLASISPVPALSPVGALALGMGLMLVGAWTQQRRNDATAQVAEIYD